MAADSPSKHNRIVWRLLVLTVAMFGFGYALVPLYDTFCLAFGLNGKTGVIDQRTASASEVDESRWITVQFTSHTATGLPWEFKPLRSAVKVRPGQVMDAIYVARNKTKHSMAGRATYSVAPSTAAVHFKKTECFCFSNQLLEAGESKEMPVRFVVSRDIPKDVSTITLSYSFFNAEKYLSNEERQQLSSASDTRTVNEG